MRKPSGFGASALALLVLTQVGCSDSLGSGDDGVPPLLESATPGDGATSVSVLDDITLRFSTPLDLLSAPRGVRLEAGSRSLALKFDLDDDRTLVVTPTDPLDFGTEYRVVVSKELRSNVGVPVESAASWTFTTRGLPAPLPNIDSLRHHLRTLAHDSMRGRGSGSSDELKAAHYLEDRLVTYGLEAPPGGTVQAFDGISYRGDTILHSRNVMAVVPGTGDLADEWIVVGAHYDHIGFRDVADVSQGPNNGADDNASGTTLVLETARLLQGYVDRDGMAGTDRRSVLFMGFGAEEEGLLGSCHYVFDAPEVPLAVTRAMLNYDMVGRLREDVTVYGKHSAAAWPAMVENANEPGLSLFLPAQSAAGSDHWCFGQARIPWLAFFTGLHDEYHTPQDDVGLINFQGLGSVTRLGFRVLTRLMVTTDPPAFVGA